MAPQNIAESLLNITSILNNFKSFIKDLLQTLNVYKIPAKERQVVDY